MAPRKNKDKSEAKSQKKSGTKGKSKSKAKTKSKAEKNLEEDLENLNLDSEDLDEDLDEDLEADEDIDIEDTFDSLVLVYQYSVLAQFSKENGSIKFRNSDDLLNRLVFHLDWRTPFKHYSKRPNFYWGFSVEDANIHLIEGKFETLEDSDLTDIKYLVEVAITPEKLSHEHYDHLIKLIEDLQEDDYFRVWWVGDEKTQKKKSKAQKTQVLKDLKSLSLYQKEDDIDLDLEDNRIPLEEALTVLGFEKDSDKFKVEKDLKQRVREMVLKYHPDVNQGEDIFFKKIQECKNRLQEWIEDI